MRYEAALSERPQQFIQFTCFVVRSRVRIDPMLLSVSFVGKATGKLQTAALTGFSQYIKIYASA
jgi:hypothetical protein